MGRFGSTTAKPTVYNCRTNSVSNPQSPIPNPSFYFTVFSHSRITHPTFARLSGEHLSGVSPCVCQAG